MHGGGAPQVKKKALQRLQEAADPAAAELVRISTKADSESVRVSAIKEILDRAGYTATQKHEIETTLTTRDGKEEKLDQLLQEITTTKGT